MNIKYLKLLVISITFLIGFATPLFAAIAERSPFVPVIVKTDSEAEIADLEEMGFSILRSRENIYLGLLPRESYESLTSSPTRSLSVSGRLERGREVTPAMDMAREWYGASRIHSGEGLPFPFTGKNVVAGICDIGFDPMHAAFRNPDGSSRIGRIVQYREGEGERLVMETPEQYAAWITDNADKTHASHVAGILGSSYRDNGLYGMAPDCQLVITLSQLSDVGLLCGAEDILDYARERGLPAVINMSMANYLGPHDGTSLFSQYLDMIGREAIVVMSAGNKGQSTETIRYSFSTPEDKVGVVLSNHAWTQFDMYGLTEIWSHNDSRIRIRVGIYDGDTNRVMELWDELSPLPGETVIFSSDGISEAEKGFAKYFTGEAYISAFSNDINDRYYISFEYDARTEPVSSHGPWARYHLYFEVYGDPGQLADIYADGVYTRFQPIPLPVMPGPDLSISDLATGCNLVSVGMYKNHPRPEEDPDTFIPGDLSPGSGYGTLIDGRILPHTVAPGHALLSAMSYPYIAANPDREAQSSASAEVFGRMNHWYYESGTSMSAPYTAGVIACWLEANPDLTIDDVHEIIETTNIREFSDPLNPRHGHGHLDPYEGLKLALAVSGLNPGQALDTAELKIMTRGHTLCVWNPGKNLQGMTVYDLSGRKVMDLLISDPYSEHDLSLLSKGIYVIASADRAFSAKITL